MQHTSSATGARRARKLPIGLLIFASFVWLSSTPASGTFQPALTDPYFQREYDWAMFIDVQDSQHYLHYSGSRLYPLTKVRVYMRALQNARVQTDQSSSAQMYEELWYSKQTAIGLRRLSRLNLTPDHPGAVVIGTAGGNADESYALVNALVRLLVELQFKSITTAAVMVPSNDYGRVSSELGRYHFTATPQIMDGTQVSIHLVSYPLGQDQYFFLER